MSQNLRILRHVMSWLLAAFTCLFPSCQKTSDPDSDNVNQKTVECEMVDYGQEPTAESLIALFRDWNNADQIEEPVERKKAMELIYVGDDEINIIFKDQADRLRNLIDLNIKLDTQCDLNRKRSKLLIIETIEAFDLADILSGKRDPFPGDADELKMIRDLAPTGTPIFFLKIRWKKPMGGRIKGPFFFLNNHWTYVPDPGDYFKVAIKNIDQKEVDQYENNLRNWLKEAKDRGAKMQKKARPSQRKPKSKSKGDAESHAKTEKKLDAINKDYQREHP